jgi:DNA polymerase-4
MSPAVAVAHVEGLRARIFDATALTVSAGVGGSKLIAKIASDLAKPDGLRTVPAGTESEFLRELAVARLPGVGPKLAAHLETFAIATIGQIADLGPERAAEIFGRSARAYHDLARGIDPRSVIPERLRKSLSTEATFEHNLLGDAHILPILREQAQEVAAALAARGLRAATIGLKIKRTDFTIRSRQTHLREPTANERIIFAAARFCWRTSGFATIPLRLVGLRAADLWDEGPAQLALW